MAVTVSIVLHRTAEKLISSVLNTLEKEPVAHIWFVDNSPDDSLKDKIPTKENITYLHVPNKGYGNAHNIAIRQAVDVGSDYHLVLNPDVRWEGKILDLLTQIFESEKDCMLVQPRIVYPDGTLQHTCRMLPAPFDVFAKRFLPGSLIKKRMERYLLPDRAYSHRFNAVYMQGSFMLFRTSCFDTVGTFDERFFMYPEDIDMTRRVRQSAFKAIYTPEVTIIHDHAAASSRFNRMLRIHIVNMMRYFNKWGWFSDKERRRLNRELLDDLKNTQ